MKRLLITLALLSPIGYAAADGGSHSIGGPPSIVKNLKVTGTLTITKACLAAGYTRVGNSNLCWKTAAIARAALTRDVCAARAAPAANARAVIVNFYLSPKSANVVNQNRWVIVDLHGNGTCAAPIINQAATEHREQVAVAAGTALSSDVSDTLIPLATMGGSYSMIYNDDAGNQGTAAEEVRGYLE